MGRSSHAREHTVLITGAAGGIGSAIARRVAADSARLLLVGRTEHRLARIAAEIRQFSPAHVQTHALDMTDAAALHEFGTALAGSKAAIDSVIFCHGNYVRARLEDSSVEDLDRLYAANVRGPFLLTKLLLPVLRRSRGQIVFINSTLGLKGSEHAGQYAAMQHALKGMADTLRNEVNPSGIRVVSVFCGRTATPLQRRIFEMEGRAYSPEFLSQPDDIAQAVSAALKLGPHSEITDIRIRPMHPLPPTRQVEAGEEETLTKLGMSSEV
jgi:NADP-dependent 3-hydroxy acid dehydrogenase YdfG